VHYDHDEPKARNDEPQRRIVVATGIQYLLGSGTPAVDFSGREASANGGSVLKMIVDSEAETSAP